jgi:phospholipase/carboxylesterase
MLETRVLNPESADEGTPVVVLLHGRGADPSDLAPLRSRFPADTAMVLPRAPHRAAPWGYGPGWAWYRYEGDDRPEVDSFRSSQEALEELLGGLSEVLGYEHGPVALGGFSQGGTLSLGHALQNPGAVAAVLVFSGFLPDHPDVDLTPEAVSGTAFWWGHGTRDPAIPHAMAVRGRKALLEAGADLETGDYPIGHGISPGELGDAVSWLSSRLGLSGSDA